MRRSSVPFALLFAVLAVALVGGWQKCRYIHGHERQARLLATVLAANLAPSLEQGEIDRAEAALAALDADPRFAAAGIYDEHGALFASHRRNGANGKIELLPETAPALRVGHSAHSVEAAVPLPGASGVLGTVYLREDLSWCPLVTPLAVSALLAFLGVALFARRAGGVEKPVAAAPAPNGEAARQAAAREAAQENVLRQARAEGEALRSSLRRAEAERDDALREAARAAEAAKGSPAPFASQAAPQQAAPFDLSILLDGLAETTRRRAAAQRVGFGFEKVGALPAAVVGDAAALHYALFGLLDQAIAATPSGRIDFVTGSLGEKIRFEVRDTGGERDLDEIRALVAALGGTLKEKAADEVHAVWFDLAFAEA